MRKCQYVSPPDKACSHLKHKVYMWIRFLIGWLLHFRWVPYKNQQGDTCFFFPANSKLTKFWSFTKCALKVILSHKGNSYCFQVAIIQKTTKPTSFSNKMEFSVFQSDQQLTCVEASCCQLTYQLQEFGSKSVATFLVSPSSPADYCSSKKARPANSDSIQVTSI